MRNLSLLLVAGLLLPVFADERVSNVSVTPVARGARAAIAYDLAETSFVTVRLQTNGVDVVHPGLHLSGDVNRIVVADGKAKAIVWNVHEDFPGLDGSVKATVVARRTGALPDYMVIDLLTGARSFYDAAADVPGGVGDIVYKTDRLVMRRIHAAAVEWRMGQQVNGEKCHDGNTTSIRATATDAETGHLVSFTEDFYIGIYEITQRQYFNVIGENPSLNKSGTGNYDDTRAFPLEKVSYHDLRGAGVDWPNDAHAVAEDSVVDLFRRRTGIDSMDLPTEAQWEFACRAGTRTIYNSGVDGVMEELLEPLAWYGGAKGTAGGQVTHEVGTKAPNAWGLYDMHGNVYELCLDWLSLGDDYRATFAPGWENGAATVDPVGPDSGTYRVIRGGDYFYSPFYARSCCRICEQGTPDMASHHQGFRLVCKGTLE